MKYETRSSSIIVAYQRQRLNQNLNLAKGAIQEPFHSQPGSTRFISPNRIFDFRLSSNSSPSDQRRRKRSHPAICACTRTKKITDGIPRIRREKTRKWWLAWFLGCGVRSRGASSGFGGSDNASSSRASLSRRRLSSERSCQPWLIV